MLSQPAAVPMVLTLNPDPTDEEDPFVFFVANAIDGALGVCLCVYAD